MPGPAAAMLKYKIYLLEYFLCAGHGGAAASRGRGTRSSLFIRDKTLVFLLFRLFINDADISIFGPHAEPDISRKLENIMILLHCPFSPSDDKCIGIISLWTEKLGFWLNVKCWEIVSINYGRGPDCSRWQSRDGQQWCVEFFNFDIGTFG